MYHNVEIIAEVKTTSPFGFQSDRTWEEMFAIAEKVGDMISIHTDPRWGGSFQLLHLARGMTRKPILAKGIHADDKEIQQALDCGADWVLVVGRIPAIHTDKCMIEPISLKELSKIPEDLRVVWNARDLASGGRKRETFEEARKIFKGWLCQASHIRIVADIKDGTNAVLVGENLEKFVKSIHI